MLKTILALLVPALLLGIPARGETVTHSAPYEFIYSLASALGDTSSGTAIKPADRNFSKDPFAVTAFDSSLGTLTGITVKLELSLSSTAFILHDSFVSPNPSILQLWSFGVGYVLTPSSSVSGSFLVYGNTNAASSGSYIISTGANNLGSFNDFKSETKTLSLSSYNTMTRDGQLLFDLYLSGDITIPDTHPLFRYLSAEGSATVSGNLFVTYEYDAIPEPGALLLLLLGVFPLVGRWRGVLR